MHQVDSGFKEAKLKRAEKKRRSSIRKWSLFGGLGLLAVMVGAGTFTFGIWGSWLGLGQYGGPVIVPGEETAGAPVYIPAIVDLAGDPMKISLGDNFGPQVTRLVGRPEPVPPERVSGQIAVLTDTMITVSQRFMTTLPSSPKDFAFYQSQRVRAPPVSAASPPVEEVLSTEVSPVEGSSEAAVPEDMSGGWGADLSGDGGEIAVVEHTRIENTTSVAIVRPEDKRYQPVDEYVGRILVDRTLESVMADNSFAAADAKVFASAMASLLEKDSLKAGDVIAIRGFRPNAEATVLRPVQVSLYTSGGYIGTLSRADDGTVAIGADPWVYEELFNYSGQEEVAQPGQQYRLLDAIYSTAVRNRVPTGVLGEAIKLLSRSFDLNAFASSDDRLILAYAKEAGEGGAGRVLYIAVKGTDRSMECYVFKLPNDGDYSCFTENSRGQSVAVPSGMVTPVSGVLTSTFGPRMHPIFKEVRVHTRVDWAAPSGTPIGAAFDGTVSYVGDGQGYGNIVKVEHPGGRETFYAHMNGFAPGLAVGQQLRAGDLVGYVGFTGNSTGPHLHFELRLAGVAIDPLQSATTMVADGDGSAVEALTDRIVQVESGGNATAQNPLSSATGLGQFIKSTWIRMMNTYRPDLARSMSEEQLLALRNDPTISREMVANLAREGESYLRARGHSITAGRLYLSHFLGMEGAATVLSAEPSMLLVDLLGQGVISANPFLTGRDVAYVIDWAERKMSGSRRSSAPPPQVVSPEFRIYQAAINEMLAPTPPAVETGPQELPPGEPAPSQDTAMLNSIRSREGTEFYATS